MNEGLAPFHPFSSVYTRHIFHHFEESPQVQAHIQLQQRKSLAIMGGLLSLLASKMATPHLIDRKTGKEIREIAPFSGAFRLWILYQTWIGQLLLLLPMTWWVLTWQHHRIAKHADSPKSKKDIPKMLKSYPTLDASAAEKPVSEYNTLQEFFTRRLKPGLRPIAAEGDGRVAVQPADSRVVVYDTVEAAHKFWIKGRHFDLGRLMGPGYDTKDHWSHAAIAINRLAPQDIHRLFASVTGRVVKIRQRGTRFMGSEHAAIHSRMDVMTENDRLVMEFESEHFGTVVQVMIGASEVGSVKPLVKEGQNVNKGDEVAVFAYGGSIMATIFGHGAIVFDDDLINNSQNNAETLVTYGSSLGHATGRPHTHPPAGAQE